MVHLLASGLANGGGIIEQALPFNLVLFEVLISGAHGSMEQNSTKPKSQFISPIFTPLVLIVTMQQQLF
jgi:hypothetical protein